MRRVKNNWNFVGTALLGAGLIMLLLGFFGAAAGVPGLLMLGVGREQPRLDLGCLTNIAPGSMQKVRAYFYWIELLPNDLSARHHIVNVPLECYLDGVSKGVSYTNNNSIAEWVFEVNEPGEHKILVAFHGNQEFPACNDTIIFFVKERPSPTVPPTVPQPEPAIITNREDNMYMANFLKYVGLALVLLGLVTLVRRI